MDRKHSPLASGALVALALVTWMPGVRAQEEGPSKQALSAAEYHVEQLEAHAKRMRGQPFDPNRFGSQAMTRVRDLYKEYPEHPKVKELFERVRAVVKISRGDVFEITPEMLAYRSAEKDLVEKIGQIAAQEWQAYLERFRASGRLLEQPFPAAEPGTREGEDATYLKKVVLEGFQYPTHEFRNSGRQFCFVGDPKRGYYYVDLSDRRWLGAYEALKRYRRSVQDEVADRWTVTGTIIGFDVLVPYGGEATAADVARPGWIVQPEAIHVEGQIFAISMPAHPEGGYFAGEDRLDELKRPFLTVTSVPDDVEPARLVEIFAASIKEKNWDLYLDCIDPAQKAAGPKSLIRMRSWFEINIRRFDETYVHIDPFEVGPVQVVKGEKFGGEGDLEGFFLDEEDEKELESRADDLVEQVAVKIRAFDEKGKQVGSPKDVLLRRTKGGRWHVYDGWPL